ncbi:MAG TPA: transporter substrate-binding domain-containing protein [Amycolatopsis sp.]|nr:transporter substrate-binding domain-containing protein [Amycolatopsis sp.]
MVHADEKPSTPPAELDAEETQSSDQSFRGQLYWILPIVIATLAVTLWLLLNPRWGGEVAAIVVIPINVAAVLVPLLLSFSAKGESARRTRRAKKLKVATAFTMAALLLSGGIYWATGEPDPKNYLSGVVKIGVQLEDYPGWNVSGDGKRKGFDIALAEALAEHFGFTAEYVPISHKERTDRLVAEKNDDIKLVIANFSITPEREEKIDFAGPYFVDTQGFFTWNSADRLEDIPPGKVCVPSDTTAQERLTKLGWKPAPEPSLAMCVQRLRNQADPTLAVSTDAAILQAYAAKNNIPVPAPISLGLERYGVGIPNNRPKLCKELNKAIEDFLLYQWDTAFRDHLPGLSPDGRRPTSLPECKSPGLWG